MGIKDCKSAVAQKEGGGGGGGSYDYIVTYASNFVFYSLEIGSQWSYRRRGCKFRWRGAPRIRRAAVFWTFCIG